MNDITKHERINDILLGPIERPLLKFFASRLPAWMTPDACTIIGVIGAFIILVSYALSTYNRNFLWLASLGFVINWFGDSLDGTLARHRKIERPIFGFFIDHVADAVNETMIFLGLGLTPYVNFNIASMALIAYLLMNVLVFVRTCVLGEFKISYGKLGPTEVRVLAILLNTGMFFGGLVTVFTVNAGTFGVVPISPYDLFVAFIAFLIMYFFTTTAVQETIRLGKANR